MVSQNSQGIIILPPVYEEQFTIREREPVAQAQIFNSWEISPGLITLILVLVLVITTIIFYGRSLLSFKNKSAGPLVEAISQDPKLNVKLPR